MDFKPEEVPHSDFYRVLLSTVAPRPIAWVSTLSKEGIPNLAPFSFFNVISAKPPILGFSPSLRRLENGHEVKGTLVNIRDTGEFVVNIVTYEVAEAMNATSGEYEHAVDEFELAKLAARPSQVVRPPQVAASPVSYECKVHQIIDFGTEPPSGSFVMGKVVSVHVEENVLKDGRIDPDALELVGRMGGAQYSRTRERFEMQRPPVKR